MPRTIAADCARRVVVRAGGVVHDRVVHGVARPSAAARRIDSSACHEKREMISGEPATEQPPAATSLDRAADVVRADAGDVAARPDAGARSRRRPSRGRRGASRSGSRSSASAGTHALQRPSSVASGRDGAGAAPVETDHVEPRRRCGERPTRVPAVHRARPSSTAGRNALAGTASTATTAASRSFIRVPSVPDRFRRGRRQTLPRYNLYDRASVSCCSRTGARARERRCRGTVRAPRARDPVRPDLEVNPVTQDYLNEPSPRAAKDGYDAAVILLDTPGGLSTSMRKIYTTELAVEAPGDRLRLARRRPRSLGRRLDRAGRRRARDGADDEHRLLDADRLERRRTSAATCGAR